MINNLRNKYSQAFSAYQELFKNGGIQSKAEGEKVLLDVRGNIAGDILVFIIPKCTTVLGEMDINDLIRSDHILEQQRSVVFESLKQKFKGFTLIPETFVWFINIGLLAIYANWRSDDILAIFTGKIYIAEVLSFLPAFVYIIIMPFLAKKFGFSLLKPIITVITRVIRVIRLFRNKKLEES